VEFLKSERLSFCKWYCRKK